MKIHILFFCFFLLKIPPAQSQKQRAEEAIEKANFFVEHELQAFNSHFILLLFKQIEEKYPYHFPYKLDSLLSQPPIFVDDEKYIQYYHRIAYQNPALDLSKIDSMQGLEKMMLWAIHSDKKPLDTLFFQQLDYYVLQEKNIRNIAHIALIISWLKENKQWEKVPNVLFLQAKIIEILSQNIHFAPHIISDTEMEVALGLVVLQQKQKILDIWFQYLVDSQATNGGWAMNEQGFSTQTHQHPTVLAVWLLHLYLYPEKEIEMLLK
jgi:hypothetical protein